MKILFLFQLPPPIHGASSVNKSIFDSNFIRQELDCSFIDISPASEISDIGKVSLKKIGKTFFIFAKSIYKFIHVKPDIVYLTLSPTGPGFIKDAALAIALKLIGANMVFHLHGKGINDARQRNIILNYFYKLTFKNSHVINLSEKLYSDIENLVSRDRISVVNNGVKSHTYRNEKPKIPPIRFLYLSNLTREKGVMEFLRACAANSAYSQSFTAIISGKFSNKAFAQEFRDLYKQLNLSNVTLFDGGVYGDDKLKIIENSHVMVLPTYFSRECFPLTLLEAMSAHMAIISTAEGAIADLVLPGENGVFVEKQSPASVAKAMRYFIENPEDALRMGMSGYERYCSFFTLEIFEQRLVYVLKKIAERA